MFILNFDADNTFETTWDRRKKRLGNLWNAQENICTHTHAIPCGNKVK